MGKDILAHYGVKGMKWGVRKDKLSISRGMRAITNKTFRAIKYDPFLRLAGMKISTAKDASSYIDSRRGIPMDLISIKWNNNPATVNNRISLGQRYINSMNKLVRAQFGLLKPLGLELETPSYVSDWINTRTGATGQIGYVTLARRRREKK